MELLFIASPTRSLPLPVLNSSTHEKSSSTLLVYAVLRLQALSESANLNVLVEHAQKVTTHRWIPFPTQPF